eukprot:CAMPEP_0198530426 /NCGR_PEP_ID=MMETSP1462-20131121/26347_1 /TAXON_ID=1333877 /ORGANISM="Brandtodinium nutriculum, Strain RCC3387" /LENGTH=103 /DNA_ID=CAMNT_0044260299 /DNA_START=245 /DNA_END=556 /DNA_ORIENTATION=-
MTWMLLACPFLANCLHKAPNVSWVGSTPLAIICNIAASAPLTSPSRRNCSTCSWLGWDTACAAGCCQRPGKGTACTGGADRAMPTPAAAVGHCGPPHDEPSPA